MTINRAYQIILNLQSIDLLREATGVRRLSRKKLTRKATQHRKSTGTIKYNEGDSSDSDLVYDTIANHQLITICHYLAQVRSFRRSEERIRT